MKNIFILGGYGYTGRFIAKHLLAQTDARIIIAGRHLDKALAFTSSLDTARAQAQCVDAANQEYLQKALWGVDLCLVAAPTTKHTENVIRACIHSKIDYLDIQFASAKLKQLAAAEQEIRNAGLCFITEAGYHPGLPSALIRYAAAKFDSLESALTAGYLNMKNIPYTEAVDELMEGFLDYQAQVFKNGTWTAPSNWTSHVFDFGPEIGKRTCYSMFFEELRAIPTLIPSIKETGFYISGANWFADLIVTPIVFIGLKAAPKRGLRPLGKLMWWAMGRSGPPHIVAVKVEAHGRSKGQLKTANIQVSHPDGYELTAIPVTAYLLQYLDGTARRPGVHMLGHIVEPVRFFKDMQTMGAEVVES